MIVEGRRSSRRRRRRRAGRRARPADQSVGLGGLPNEEGVVQLDASCMHGPTKRAGAVGALEDIATPAAVAKAVMDYTDHIMLVGAGRADPGT